MSFSSAIFNYHKKLLTMPTLSSRLLANLIDLILVFILLAPIFNFINHLIFAGQDLSSIIPQIETNGSGTLTEEQNMQIKKAMIDFFINGGISKLIINMLCQLSLVIALFYISWCFLGNTPGKYLLGMKIVDEKTFKDPSKYQFFIRAISIFLSIFTLGLGYIALIFDKNKRAWHDRIAGTMIIDPKKHKSPSLK